MRSPSQSSPPVANLSPARLMLSPALAAVGVAMPPLAPRVADAAVRVSVAEVMSAAPAPLSPATSLAEAAARLDGAEGCAAHILPVVPAQDGAPWPVGMFGRAELTAAWRRGLAPQTPVQALMIPFVLAVPAAAPLAQGVALMAFEGVHVLAVLGEKRQLVGMLGALDVLRWLSWAACDS